jgi:predicted nucleic acid-binding protein
MTVLVDSYILIEVSRGRNAPVIARWLDLGESDAVVLCSPVSHAELWAGARPQETDTLVRLFHSIECTAVDGETGRLAGEYLRQYRKSHGVEIADALIAAAAVLHRAQLWTMNRKHYPMKGLAFFE